MGKEIDLVASLLPISCLNATCPRLHTRILALSILCVCVVFNWKKLKKKEKKNSTPGGLERITPKQNTRLGDLKESWFTPRSHIHCLNQINILGALMMSSGLYSRNGR